ncbi:MAG: glycosyltransferase [Bryobacterales bacterium]|nr:glycosyltransferase [Bryobacterales bacterium]
MTPLLAFLQSWHELDFNLGGPEDIDYFPWSAPVAVLVLLLLFFFLYKGRRNYNALPSLAPVEGGEKPDVTVVIPARNEQSNIGPCVAGLREARVIVVDDDSSDATAFKARGAGAEVLAAPALPRGVSGKANAMAAGAKLADTAYILFADAGTRYQPGFLSSAERYAAESQSVMAVILLKRRCVTLLEKMLVPYVQALYFAGINVRKAQDPLSTHILSDGQCTLFLRTAHEFFGGYMSVHTNPLDDVAIAQKVKRHHMTLRIVRAESLGSARVYKGFASLWRRLRKNGARLLRINKAWGAQVILTSLLLTGIVPVAVWLWRQEQWGFLAAFLLVPLLLFRPWYGGFFRAVLLFPAVYIFQCIATAAVLANILGVKTTWKGRKV